MLPVAVLLRTIIKMVSMPVFVTAVVATDEKILIKTLTKTKWVHRKLPPTFVDNHTDAYHVFSSDKEDVRWCSDVDGPTSSMSLNYSYLVESTGYIHTRDVETSLIAAVANRTLKCAYPWIESIDNKQSQVKIVALEMGSRIIILDNNLCKSGVHCSVISTTWNLALEGYTNHNENSQILADMLSIIEATVQEVSFGNLSVSFISDMPTLVSKAQGFATLTSGKELKRGTSVFTITLITISATGTLIMFLVLLHHNATNDESDGEAEELDVPTSITVLKSSASDDAPSERAQSISPCNLDAKRFIYESEEDLHFLMRMGNRSNYRGFRLELDTVVEENDIEEGGY